jgi:hypothetical protein
MITKEFNWKDKSTYDIIMQTCMEDGGAARVNGIRQEDNPFINFEPEMAGAWEIGWVSTDEAFKAISEDKRG